MKWLMAVLRQEERADPGMCCASKECSENHGNLSKGNRSSVERNGRDDNLLRNDEYSLLSMDTFKVC